MCMFVENKYNELVCIMLCIFYGVIHIYILEIRTYVNCVLCVFIERSACRQNLTLMNNCLDKSNLILVQIDIYFQLLQYSSVLVDPLIAFYLLALLLTQNITLQLN